MPPQPLATGTLARMGSTSPSSSRARTTGARREAYNSATGTYLPNSASKMRVAEPKQLKPPTMAISRKSSLNTKSSYLGCIGPLGTLKLC